jgi:hypothetical protein
MVCNGGVKMDKNGLLKLLYENLEIFKRLAEYIRENNKIPKDYNYNCRNIEEIIEENFAQKGLDDFIDDVRPEESEERVVLLDDEEGEESTNEIEDTLTECEGYEEAIRLRIEKVKRMPEGQRSQTTRIATDKASTQQIIHNNNYGSGTINSVLSGSINYSTQTAEFAKWLERNKISQEHVESFKKEMQGATKENVKDKFGNWIRNITFVVGMADKIPAIIENFTKLFIHN